MSQWYDSPFEVDGVTYASTEMWMMIQKAKLFGDEVLQLHYKRYTHVANIRSPHPANRAVDDGDDGALRTSKARQAGERLRQAEVG